MQDKTRYPFLRLGKGNVLLIQVKQAFCRAAGAYPSRAFAMKAFPDSADYSLQVSPLCELLILLELVVVLYMINAVDILMFIFIP